MVNDNITKPFLKWVGGKTQIIDMLLENYPKKINNYHDIFLGGGSTLLAFINYINNKKIIINGKIYAYDSNNILIYVYKNIQIYPKKLYKKIKTIITDYNNCKTNKIINRNANTKEEAMESHESYYYWIRKKYNNLENNKQIDIIGSAMFIFLNKTCFRGIYRVGKNGFNVPFGHYKNPKIIDKKTILNISELIKNVKFKCLDFTESLARIKKNDFVYLDPPYVPEKETSFVGYNFGGFCLEQHKNLIKICNNMKKKNIKFILSNSNTKLIIKSFPNNIYNVIKILCKRAIHSKNPSKKTLELIIKSY